MGIKHSERQIDVFPVLKSGGQTYLLDYQSTGSSVGYHYG